MGGPDMEADVLGATASPNNLDAIALAISQQSASVTFGAAVLAAIALLVGGIGTIVVVSRAKTEAQKAAKLHMEEVGPALLKEWLESNLPRYLRELKEMQSSDVDGDGVSDFDAADMGSFADEASQRQSDGH